MKIAVTGKGGVGKTAIAVALGMCLSSKREVLLVDADPSLNLATVFKRENITPIGEMVDLANERARLPEGLVKMNPKVADIVDKFSVEVGNNLKLLVVGTVTKAGSGCLCPENAILRSVLQDLVLKRDEIVIVDMEAGLEPMSRGTIRRVDSILVVTEPSLNSLSVSERMIGFARQLGIDDAKVVANRIRDAQESELITTKLEIFHEIPYDAMFQKAFMKGDVSSDSEFYKSVSKLAEKIVDDE